MSEEREYTFYRGHALLHGFREVFPVCVSGRGIHSIASLCYLYEGLGYGKRQVVWETIEGLKLRNKDYSYKGIAAELGLLVKVRKMALSLGVITIKGEYWEPTVGVGINF